MTERDSLRIVLGQLAAAAFALLGGAARADDATPARRATVDRIAVRYWAPEGGGAGRPRFITERVLAFEARLEALGEESFGGAAAYRERHVRAAIERHVAEDLLAALTIVHGSEPPNLPRAAESARLALEDRVGGHAALEAARAAEGIDESDLKEMLYRQLRAAHYVDLAITPILHPTEEELREVFRTNAHPFRGQKLDDPANPGVRARFVEWLVLERLRQAESGFLQAARTRTKIVAVAVTNGS
jgi:hypothetical protein